MPLVPESFIPPDRREFAGFALHRLSPIFCDQDFLAVTRNADQIRYVFGPTNGWPSRSLSFEENLLDLRRHDQEFADKKAFAYSIVSDDESTYLGCLYIKPIKSRIENDKRKNLFDAQVYFWLTAEAKEIGLEAAVQHEVKRWLEVEWTLKSLAFPGRTIAWDAWEALA